MEAVNDRLVRREHSLIQLFDPPFDKSPLDPGYIKGYVPGVRENGGQYTHAAIWTVMAFAALGDRQRAWELLSLINPLNHGSTPAGIATYKVEPYVVAADVYAVAPHTGRGGWTWYTGSAGWMYRLIVESLLGVRLDVDKLRFFPCLPDEWPSFKLHYRYRDTFYHVTVKNNGGHEANRVTSTESINSTRRFIWSMIAKNTPRKSKSDLRQSRHAVRSLQLNNVKCMRAFRRFSDRHPNPGRKTNRPASRSSRYVRITENHR